MHRKTVLKPYKVWDQVTASADLTSAHTSTEYMDRISVQIDCGAGINGQLYVQVSNDKLSWFDLPLALAPLTGSAEEYYIDIQETSFQFIRLFLDWTSGTGTVSATIGARES